MTRAAGLWERVIYKLRLTFTVWQDVMKNIFILNMPPANAEAMVHYEDTIRRKVDPARIHTLVSPSVSRKLNQVFGPRPIAVWGSRDSAANRSKYDQMKEGDEILIVVGDSIKLLGHVAAKECNPKLSRELWKNLQGGENEGWDLIYFIANPKELDVPFREFNELFGYAPHYHLRGFTRVAEANLEAFYQKYDDLYSILLLLKDGQPVREVSEPDTLKESLPPLAAPAAAEEPEKIASDHLRMQYLLLKLGLKAGGKVWAPRGDQSRIASGYKFSDFEETFAAGLDAQVKYVENIDVVWKEEFRIDAAFEVENSTSIYSGLLRFADLTMVAPNTLYPMFIVAPGERRTRVQEQLARPTFRHLHLAEKVRYLPYERVEEVDQFFEDNSRGFTVQVLVGKSEVFPTR